MRHGRTQYSVSIAVCYAQHEARHGLPHASYTRRCARSPHQAAMRPTGAARSHASSMRDGSAAHRACGTVSHAARCVQPTSLVPLEEGGLRFDADARLAAERALVSNFGAGALRYATAAMVCAATSAATGDGLQWIEAGCAAGFTLELLDRRGRPCAEDSTEVTAELLVVRAAPGAPMLAEADHAVLRVAVVPREWARPAAAADESGGGTAEQPAPSPRHQVSLSIDRTPRAVAAAGGAGALDSSSAHNLRLRLDLLRQKLHSDTPPVTPAAMPTPQGSRTLSGGRGGGTGGVSPSMLVEAGANAGGSGSTARLSARKDSHVKFTWMGDGLVHVSLCLACPFSAQLCPASPSHNQRESHLALPLPRRVPLSLAPASAVPGCRPSPI